MQDRYFTLDQFQSKHSWAKLSLNLCAHKHVYCLFSDVQNYFQIWLVIGLSEWLVNKLYLVQRGQKFLKLNI